MKKLFLILVLGLLVGMANAQRSYQSDGVSTYWNVALTAADTISSTDAITWVYTPSAHVPLTQDLTITLDSLDAPGVSVQLKGKKFSGESYANIGSAVVWAGSSADTTFTISNATANRYRYIAVTATSTTGKSQITNLEFKVWKE